MGDDIDNYKKTRRDILKNQAKAVAIIVVPLSLVAWWRQGFFRALVGGALLYLCLMALILMANYFENRSRGRNE